MAYSNRRIVFGFASIVVVAFGSILYGFSVYVTDGAAGADFSTTVLSLGLTGAGVAAALLARPLGRFMDRHGARGVTVAGAAVACAGMIGFSLSQEPWHVLASWWLLIGPATAAIYYEPSMIGIAGWISPVNHAKAYGALSFLGGFAGAIFVPLTERLVSAFGWRTTVQVLGLLILVTGVVAGFAAIPSGRGRYASAPSPTTAKMRDLVADRRFVYFTLALMLGFLSIQGLLAHRVDRFSEAGFPIAVVAVWAGIASIISLPGRYMAPILVNRFRATRITALVFVLLAVSILIAVPGTSDVSMVGHFVVFGIAFGAITPLRAMVMTKWYAGDRYGQISGTQLAVMSIVAAFGATIVGVARDIIGEYGPIFVGTAIAVGAAALLTIMAGNEDDRLKAQQSASSEA